MESGRYLWGTSAFSELQFSVSFKDRTRSCSQINVCFVLFCLFGHLSLKDGGIFLSWHNFSLIPPSECGHTQSFTAV